MGIEGVGLFCGDIKGGSWGVAGLRVGRRVDMTGFGIFGGRGGRAKFDFFHTTFQPSFELLFDSEYSNNTFISELHCHNSLQKPQKPVHFCNKSPQP